jgi:hypothetical protein
MANKQTAVEYLIEEISSKAVGVTPKCLLNAFEKAKAMEKEQIENAWDDAYDKGTRDRIEKISNPVGNAEQYYNKTFKSE